MQILVKPGYESGFMIKFIITFLIITIIDSVWLFGLAPALGTYSGLIPKKDNTFMVAAIMVCYWFISAFTISMIKARTLTTAVSFYGLLAFLVYYTFNATSFIVFNSKSQTRWPLSVAIMDIIAGMIVYTLTGVISDYVIKAF